MFQSEWLLLQIGIIERDYFEDLLIIGLFVKNLLLDYNKSAKVTAFEFTSGRKEECIVLDYFSYDKVFNKSICPVV